MGLLDNYTGIGLSPRPHWRHQMAMSNFLANASKELKKKNLLLLTEATVTDNWNDLAPDLIIFDQRFVPLSIIEITRSEQTSLILEKCEKLMGRFPYAEYFVYDYEQKILYASDAEQQEWITSEEYTIKSRYLKRSILDYFI